MSKFTQELVDKTIKYFKEKYDHDISPETAEEYLKSLGNLYRSISKFPHPNETNKIL